MKIYRDVVELDAADRGILEGLQDNCKQSLALPPSPLAGPWSKAP